MCRSPRVVDNGSVFDGCGTGSATFIFSQPYERKSMNRLCFTTMVVLILLGPAAADEVEQGPQDSSPSGLLAGVARADITPPAGIAQMNWGSQSHILSVGNDPSACAYGPGAVGWED